MSKDFRGYNRIGERISSLARNQTEVARVLGVCQQSISKKLRGETGILIADLEKLARHYNVPVTFFFEEPDGAPKPAGIRKFTGMTPDAQDLVRLATELPGDDVRKILVMAQLLVGDTGKTRESTRPSAS